MELTELIPERVQWKAKASEAVELELFMRPFNLEDESWLRRNYPGDELQKVFSEMRASGLTKICYHQLEPESKKKVMDVKFIDIDEEGKEIEIAKSGPEKIAYMVSGYSATMDLLNCLLKTRGLSIPLLEEIVRKVGMDGLEKMTHISK